MKIALCTHSDAIVYKTLQPYSLGKSDAEHQELLRIMLETAPMTSDQLGFLPRSFCETQPYFKQLIPYVVLIRDNELGHQEVLTYVRGNGGTEERLHAKLSVGFGGHMDDVSAFHHASSLLQLISTEANRELQEELGLTEDCELVAHSTILEDGSAVDSVHMGIVMLCYVGRSDFAGLGSTSPEADTITDLSWVPLTELSKSTRLESWSKIVAQRLLA